MVLCSLEVSVPFAAGAHRTRVYRSASGSFVAQPLLAGPDGTEVDAGVLAAMETGETGRVVTRADVLQAFADAARVALDKRARRYAAR